MSALPHFSCIDKNPGPIGPRATSERADASGESVCDAAPVRSGKALANVDARISSLKILAQSIMREIHSLEKEDPERTPDVLDLQAEVHRFEAELIRSALARTEGRQRRAARLLGMKVTTLNSKIRRYKIA